MFLLPSVAVGCGHDCKAYGQAGLAIHVTDKAGADLCDAVVTARDGTYSEVLQSSTPAGQPCSYFGAFEREGTYVVEAYSPSTGTSAVATNARVSGGQCDVHEARRTIIL